MTLARLLVREVGQREFVAYNGDYVDEEAAEAAGARLTVEGNVEAFQVWTLYCAKERHWALREIEMS